MEEKQEIFLIAPGKSIVTLEGVKGPGAMIEKRLLKTPGNFDALVDKGLIVKKENYNKNDASQFRAPAKAEEVKAEEVKAEEVKAESKKADIKKSDGAKKVNS